MKAVASFAVLLLTSTSALADVTAYREITALRVSGVNTEKTVYFETASNWGVAACPTAKYVYIRNNVALQEILAVGLSAKMTGGTVSFTGECAADGLHFLAHYVVLQ